MATVVKYWNPDSAAGGTGDDPGTAGANRAYHDYPELEAAEATGLPTDGDIFQARRSGTAVDAVRLGDLTGWVTGASNYLQIMSDDGVRKTVTNTVVNTRIIRMLNADHQYVRVEGFDFEQNQASSPRECIGVDIGAATGDVRFDNVRAFNAGTGRHGFYFRGGISKISNCAAFANAGSGFFNNSASLVELYCRYCVAYNNGARGFTSASSPVANLINCYAGANTTADYDSDFATITNCASSDTTGDTGLQNIAASTSAGAYFTNLTAGSEDFHIDADNSALEDAGTDVSSDTDFAVSLDAEGNTRHATTPDIGMYESVGGGPEDLPIPGKLINGNAITRAAYW